MPLNFSLANDSQVNDSQIVQKAINDVNESVRVSLPEPIAPVREPDSDEKYNGLLATLFAGMNTDSKHRKAAITHTLLCLLRRFYFAAAIVFMSHMPLVTICSMLIFSVVMLVFNAAFNPWMEAGAQKLAIFNEFMIILILSMTLACSSMTVSGSREGEALGYVLVGMVTLAILINVIAMQADAWSHIKKLLIGGTDQKSDKIADLELQEQPSSDEASPKKVSKIRDADESIAVKIDGKAQESKASNEVDSARESELYTPKKRECIDSERAVMDSIRDAYSSNTKLVRPWEADSPQVNSK